MTRAIWRRRALTGLVLVVLLLTFVAYFSPGLQLEMANAWAFCSAVLR